MRIWDEVRQELERLREEHAGQIAALRAEVAGLKADVAKGSAPPAESASDPRAEPPAVVPEAVQPEQ